MALSLRLPLAARAPAKVNLCLHVGRVREDGLHEICSLFQSVTLADELLMEQGAGSDEVICPEIAEPNLAAEALARFREQFGWRGTPVRITIRKRIPIAAGLGGGSADAAATLRLAVAASGIEPDPDRLGALAMSLGADVPSQLVPGTQIVTGAGEWVESIELGSSPSLLILAGEGRLSTAAVYTRADALGLPARDLDRIAAELRDNSKRGPLSELQLHNDLEAAAVELEPAAGRALELLRESGALAAIVSGSGPAAVGVYADDGDAARAKKAIERRWSGSAWVVGAADAPYAAPFPVATASASRSGSGQ